MLKESTEAHLPTPCYGYAKVISHKKGETAVHGCHYPVDMVVRMRRVAIPYHGFTTDLVTCA